MQTGIYRHYKGQLYHVIGASRHSETLEEVVVYRALYGSYGLWVRPRTMFEEEIMQEGRSIASFTFLHSLDDGPLVD